MFLGPQLRTEFQPEIIDFQDQNSTKLPKKVTFFAENDPVKVNIKHHQPAACTSTDYRALLLAVDCAFKNQQ
jgi:hypothetical protein